MTSGLSDGAPASRQGWWWCAASALLFGAATPAIKPLLDHAGSVVVAGLLYLGAALAAAPFGRSATREPVPSAQRWRLLGAVALGGGLAPVLLVTALDRTPAGTVSLLLNLEMVATAVIARVFLREHIGGRAGVGIGVVVVGGVVLAGFGGTGMAPGALLVAGACLCWGIDNAVAASLSAYSPARITLVKGLVAGSVNFVIGVALDGWPPAWVVLVALVIGALGYGASITLWISGARLIGAARGQAVFALAPFIGALLSWPMADSRPSVRTAVAAALSIVGVGLVVTARHSHLHGHGAMWHEHEHLPDLEHRHPH